VEALRGELRGKQTSMDTLERQFKSKAEDYSKLQRIVESLRDELNLERKRVKNFEDLYQSIQEKRIKIINPKSE
jgi:flagellin-specific chaperone FliS